MHRFLLVRKGRDFEGTKLTAVPPPDARMCSDTEGRHLRICGNVLRHYFKLPKGQKRIWLCLSNTWDLQDKKFAYRYGIEVPGVREGIEQYKPIHLCRRVHLYGEQGTYKPMLHEITHYLAWNHPRIPVSGWVSVEYEV